MSFSSTDVQFAVGELLCSTLDQECGNALAYKQVQFSIMQLGLPDKGSAVIELGFSQGHLIREAWGIGL